MMWMFSIRSRLIRMRIEKTVLKKMLIGNMATDAMTEKKPMSNEEENKGACELYTRRSRSKNSKETMPKTKQVMQNFFLIA